MITKIEINGYKSLVSTSIELKNLNIFAGANGAGKSSIIQTLLLLRQSEDDQFKVQKIELSGELYEGGTSSDVIHPNCGHQIDILIESDDIQYKYLLVYDREENSGEPSRDLKISDGINELPISLSRKTNNFSYVNSERIGPRVQYAISNRKKYSLSGPVGKHGEFTAWQLARCAKNTLIVPGWPQQDDSTTTSLRQKIIDSVQSLDRLDFSESLINSEGRIDLVSNDILSWIIPGCKFNAEEQTSSDQASLKFEIESKKEIRPTHTGFGITYTLPIIAAALSLDTNSLIIVENPEAHLHPYSQSRIGYFLALIAACNRQVIIETHSDHVINGIRLAVKQNRIDSTKVSFNSITKNTAASISKVEQIKIDGNGKLEHWPIGFFDQIENDLAML